MHTLTPNHPCQVSNPEMEVVLVRCNDKKSFEPTEKGTEVLYPIPSRTSIFNPPFPHLRSPLHPYLTCLTYLTVPSASLPHLPYLPYLTLCIPTSPALPTLPYPLHPYLHPHLN